MVCYQWRLLSGLKRRCGILLSYKCSQETRKVMKQEGVKCENTEDDEQGRGASARVCVFLKNFFMGHQKQHRTACLPSLVGHWHAAVQKGFFLSFILFCCCCFFFRFFSPSLIIVPFHHLLHFHHCDIFNTYLISWTFSGWMDSNLPWIRVRPMS